MTTYDFQLGYGGREIEPKIAPLVEAVRKAGLVTFSSCEGHIDQTVDGGPLGRFASVAFYAHEDDARLVHDFFLNCRQRLACSWSLTAGFVVHRETSRWTLGWTLQNCGIKENVAESDFEARTNEAAWGEDIPLLTKMFAEIGSHRPVRVRPLG